MQATRRAESDSAGVWALEQNDMPTDLAGLAERKARQQRLARGNNLVLFGSLIFFLANLILILSQPSIARVMTPLMQ